MNEREAFLRAIDKEPDFRPYKLTFADWLDEYGTSEADAATVEWIRLTNHESNLSKTGRVRRHAFEWLKGNWERLVATARQEHKQDPTYDLATQKPPVRAVTETADWQRMSTAADEWLRQEGGRYEFQIHSWATARHLITHWNLAPPGWSDATPRFYSYRVHIHFGNGFVTAFEAVNSHAQEKLNHLVLVDQPLVKLKNYFIDVPCVRPEMVHRFWTDTTYSVSCGNCGKVWNRIRENVYEAEVTSS